MIYAGIDEAGYGPTLGPFTLGVAAFRLPGELDSAAPDLYALLAAAVCRETRDPAGRLAVNDSKALYHPGGGLGRLEEALFAFRLAAGLASPRGLAELRGQYFHPATPALEEAPWFGRDLAAPPAPAPGGLPRDADSARLESLAARLADVLRATEIALVRLCVHVTPAADWNASLARTRNKSSTSFERVRLLLGEFWEQHGEEGVFVQVDKQGGRSFYLPALQQVFPLFSITALEEGNESSSYFVAHGPRRLHLSFAPRSDFSHLPVALASIAAKYARELLMERFNAWFGAHAPGLRPTAGYPEDAKRWLADTALLRRELGIADRVLIREK